MYTHKKGVMIAVILVLVGAALCGVSFAVLGLNVKSLSSGKFETNRYDVKEEFRGISIRGNTEKITLLPSENGECSVVCYEDARERHTVSVENGTLTVKTVDKRNWTVHFGILLESPSITVYLPEKEYGQLSIEADTGDVEIPDAFQFEPVTVELDTGKASCYADAAEAVSITTDTGDIVASDLSAGEITLASDTGKIRVSGVTCGGELSVRDGTGRVEVEDVTCESFRSDGDTGSLNMKNVQASGSFTIKRDTGNVRFDGCDAASISVKTSTGDVTGTLLTGKTFSTKTDTGHVSVPQTTAGGTCEVTTDTGNIKLEVK